MYSEVQRDRAAEKIALKTFLFLQVCLDTKTEQQATLYAYQEV